MAETIRFHIQTDLSPHDLGLLWRDLENRADFSFFLSWDWMAAWIAELGHCPPVLVGESGGALVLLGLVEPRLRHEAGVIRVHGLSLHTTGDRTRDCIAIEYNGFLVDRAWTGRAEREAVAYLLRRAVVGGRRRDELHIVGMLEHQVAAFSPPGMLVQMPYRKPSWRVDLNAVRDAGKTYLDSLNANTRQQIRRSMRLYDEQGELKAERATDIPTALAWLDGLKQLHQVQWQARGKPGGFAFPFFESFQRRLITACIPGGSVELVRITRGEQPIGYLYNLIRNGHVLAFVSGFLYEADKRLKPGLVCHALAIERHLREAASIYDFLAGDTRYKSNLGAPGPYFVYLLVQRPTATTRAERILRRGWERVRALR
ncbi:MAG TPA: GNAT family N-acetyltransferase [Acetobacteraceae bacterium]|nr:GNAT family N-acetyltransferase [Acetobacteraceae bacterium]